MIFPAKNKEISGRENCFDAGVWPTGSDEKIIGCPLCFFCKNKRMNLFSNLVWIKKMEKKHMLRCSVMTGASSKCLAKQVLTILSQVKQTVRRFDIESFLTEIY